MGDLLRYRAEFARLVRPGREEFFDNSDVRNRATVEHFLELLGEGCEAVG